MIPAHCAAKAAMPIDWMSRNEPNMPKEFIATGLKSGSPAPPTSAGKASIEGLVV
jgi:hypothetical protein